MYGGGECSHENAIKSAGQELQGLVAIHNSKVSLIPFLLSFKKKKLKTKHKIKVKDLRTPMMVLIDFRGYRLIAQSFLPVTTGSLSFPLSPLPSLSFPLNKYRHPSIRFL